MNGYVEEPDIAYTNGTPIRGGRYDTRGNLKVALGSLLSYEDKENGVARVEQQMDYETVAASQTGQYRFYRGGRPTIGPYEYASGDAAGERTPR